MGAGDCGEVINALLSLNNTHSITGVRLLTPFMGRKKSYNEILAEGVLDGRSYEVLDATQKRKNTVAQVSLDPTAHISGTLPEKIVLNHLASLQVNFNFQYHYKNNTSTAYPEDIWVADFFLEDYNVYIEIYGTYWHSTGSTVQNDLIKKANWLNEGYEIFEKGISLKPSGQNTVGKVCIWWEEEVYQGVAQLFARDLPEIASMRRPGKMKEIPFDLPSEWNKKKQKQDSVNLRKMVPKVPVAMKDFRKLRDKVLTSKIYGSGKSSYRVFKHKGLGK